VPYPLSSDPTRALLSDAEWVRLIRLGPESDFGLEGRGVMSGLISMTGTLARQDGVGLGISRSMARFWLGEYERLRGLGFSSGPLCDRVADGCRAVLAVTAPPPLPPVDPASLLVPLSDAEWLTLLRDETGELDSPHRQGVISSMLASSAVANYITTNAVFEMVGARLEESPLWRPGPLLARAIAFVKADLRSSDDEQRVADLHGLIGLIPSSDPTGPWNGWYDNQGDFE
jgi:hypothetical protein